MNLELKKLEKEINTIDKKYREQLKTLNKRKKELEEIENQTLIKKLKDTHFKYKEDSYYAYYKVLKNDVSDWGVRVGSILVYKKYCLIKIEILGINFLRQQCKKISKEEFEKIQKRALKKLGME